MTDDIPNEFYRLLNISVHLTANLHLGKPESRHRVIVCVTKDYVEANKLNPEQSTATAAAFLAGNIGLIFVDDQYAQAKIHTACLDDNIEYTPSKLPKHPDYTQTDVAKIWFLKKK